MKTFEYVLNFCFRLFGSPLFLYFTKVTDLTQFSENTEKNILTTIVVKQFLLVSSRKQFTKPI